MKVLITGASGMIGSTIARVISENENFDVVGVGRRLPERVGSLHHASYTEFADLNVGNAIDRLLENYSPDVVVNCAGLTKHYPEGNDPVFSIESNSLLPHRLASRCSESSIKLIQISSDCVFSGEKGSYSESSVPDATDFYGRSKALGEVYYDNHITLRTSTIGHENQTHVGLLEWFLKQNKCTGFSKAIFSGLPTTVLGRVIRDYVLVNDNLSGLYHVGASPIDKAHLLQLIGTRYGHVIPMALDKSVVIDRSLDSSLFNNLTGFTAPNWDELIEEMYQDFIKRQVNV